MVASVFASWSFSCWIASACCTMMESLFASCSHYAIISTLNGECSPSQTSLSTISFACTWECPSSPWSALIAWVCSIIRDSLAASCSRQSLTYILLSMHVVDWVLCKPHYGLLLLCVLACARAAMMASDCCDHCISLCKLCFHSLVLFGNLWLLFVHLIGQMHDFLLFCHGSLFGITDC